MLDESFYSLLFFSQIMISNGNHCGKIIDLRSFKLLNYNLNLQHKTLQSHRKGLTQEIQITSFCLSLLWLSISLLNYLNNLSYSLINNDWNYNPFLIDKRHMHEI